MLSSTQGRLILDSRLHGNDVSEVYRLLREALFGLTKDKEPPASGTDNRQNLCRTVSQTVETVAEVRVQVGTITLFEPVIFAIVK